MPSFGEHGELPKSEVRLPVTSYGRVPEVEFSAGSDSLCFRVMLDSATTASNFCDLWKYYGQGYSNCFATASAAAAATAAAATATATTAAADTTAFAATTATAATTAISAATATATATAATTAAAAASTTAAASPAAARAAASASVKLQSQHAELSPEKRLQCLSAPMLATQRTQGRSSDQRAVFLAGLRLLVRRLR